MGYTFAIVAPIYASMIMVNIARTAAQASIMRRELVSPLPIKGAHVVLADLGVPIMVGALFGIAAGFAYAASQGPFWPQALLGMCLLFPLRLATRMVIQYLVVLANPDMADKLQQMFAGCGVNLLSIPLFFVEAILCIPAIILKSVWLGVGALIVGDALLLLLLTGLTGKALERALASGEPVNLKYLFRKEPKYVAWEH
jgi:hypothetical protein